MLNYSQAKMAVLAAADTGHAVNIIGEAGIGKTEMIKDIASEKNWNMIVITASNLKEGELSFPMLHKNDKGKTEVFYAPHHTIMTANQMYEDYNAVQIGEYEPLTEKMLSMVSNERLSQIYTLRYKEEVEFDDREEMIEAILAKPDSDYKLYDYIQLNKMSEKELEEVHMRNLAVELEEGYNKEKVVLDIIKAQPKEKTIYFIDEVGRMAPEVQSEVMNFMLEKKINEAELPPNIIMVTAQNPSSNIEGYENTNYHSQEMDPAVSSRLFHIKMSADFESWLQYATVMNKILDRQNVHQTVIEFISEASDKRLFTKTEDNVNLNNTNPRSWKHVSDLIYNIEAQPQLLDSDNKRRVLLDLISGKINTNIAVEYINFYLDNQNPLPKPQEIFKDSKGKDVSKLDEKIKERIKDEANNRKLVLALNCIEYLARGNSSSNTSKVMVEILSLFDKDLMLHPMRKIVTFSPRHAKRELDKNEEQFYSDMTKNTDYVRLFTEIFEATKKLASGK